MSFPRYPEYKDSGVEWLVEVPRHWQVKRLKSLLEEPLMYGANEAADDDDPTSPRFVRITDIYDNNLLREETFRSLPFDVAQPYLLSDGDVLLARSGATVGKSFLYQDSWGICCFAGYLIRARCKPYIFSSKFLFACCQSTFYWQYISGSQIQATIQNVSAEKYANLWLPFPPFGEQLAISAFLDRETAKIDGLMAEQEKLIALLKEKRQAVISHAVTKGLDPAVPMKDSGVEWLGEVPEHWEVASLKRFFEVFDGRRVPLSSDERSYRSGDYPYYGASGIIDSIDDYIFDEDLVLVSEDGANLVNRSTPIAFVARGKYWVNNHAHILKPMDRNMGFWAERIEVVDLLPFITGSAQPKLTVEALANLIISVPPTVEERAQIEHFIVQRAREFDSLVQEADTAIRLLRERRTALISAAVTGQIDVRGLVKEEQEQAA